MFPSMTELDQAHERLEDLAAATTRSSRQPSRTSTFRRAVGLRFIALGRRLIGEPSFELARSR